MKFRARCHIEAAICVVWIGVFFWNYLKHSSYLWLYALLVVYGLVNLWRDRRVVLSVTDREIELSKPSRPLVRVAVNQVVSVSIGYFGFGPMRLSLRTGDEFVVEGFGGRRDVERSIRNAIHRQNMDPIL